MRFGSLCILLVLFYSSCNTDKFSIEKFTHPENERQKPLDKGKELNEIERKDHFMVTGRANSKKAIEKIKKFVSEHRDVNFDKYRYYSMAFFNKSIHTNQQNLNDHPRDFVRFSVPEDMFLVFVWEKGKFVSMSYIKDGYPVRPKGSGTITIEDVQ